MIIYNVTVMVSPQIEKDWLAWLTDEHLADVLGTKCFSSATVHKLLDAENTEGPTYVIQYSADSKADYNRYVELYADDMKNRSFQKWGDAFIAFRTLMQVMHRM